MFGFGLYGHSVYLAEFQRLEGWGTAVISTASTLSLFMANHPDVVRVEKR